MGLVEIIKLKGIGREAWLWTVRQQAEKFSSGLLWVISVGKTGQLPQMIPEEDRILISKCEPMAKSKLVNHAFVSA